MKPRPKTEDERHRGSGKLTGKVALISGGDSGIGRAVAIAFAKEGGDISIVYLNEHKDAKETQSSSRTVAQTAFCSLGMLAMNSSATKQ